MVLKLIAPDPVPRGAAGGTQRVPIDDGTTARAGLVFTNKLDDVVEHELALKRMGDVAQGQSEFQNALDRKRVELMSDPDIATREERFQKFASEEHARISGRLDRTAGTMFLRAANPLADSMSMSVRHQARKDLTERAVTEMSTTNDALVIRAGDAANPNERQAILDAIDGNLKEARDKEWLTPAQYEAAKKQTLGKADQAAALRLIRENPGATERALGNSAFLPNLDPVQREQLVTRAGNEVNRRASLAYTQEARRDLAERRQARVAGDEAMKTLSDLVDQQKFDDAEDMLPKVRGVLDRHQYEAAKKLIRGGAEFDDRDTMADIVPKIDVRDVQQDLNEALRKNLITTATHKSLSERNRAALKDDQPESPYKQGVNHIKTVLDPTAQGLGNLGGIVSGLRADALLEYYAWADTNRDKIKANGQLAIDFATDVGRRYRLVEFSETTSALGLPRFYRGGREQLDETNLRQAISDTAAARDRGELSAAELLNEARKLRAWDAAIKRKLQNEKPLPQGGNR